ncbi:hypothetical protein M406DRAFT_72195 [Cryphonectria parasitica EP155]|uniref:Uncharacterized protein n=1 Tax=Cryphonectria parasitica (strain ATCC 38755 / EP155) TaxID=660469 RepID=A0A9P4XWG4_CRYP1|nr:uncharacterized protein M406DRAFT_72195 [Cryphonectria parasitica EP155]KAF3762173.1 hypothetical protein M406DRAFT_72195 [Cryphonectria parasitica EP155]
MSPSSPTKQQRRQLPLRLYHTTRANASRQLSPDTQLYLGRSIPSLRHVLKLTGTSSGRPCRPRRRHKLRPQRLFLRRHLAKTETSPCSSPSNDNLKILKAPEQKHKQEHQRAPESGQGWERHQADAQPREKDEEENRPCYWLLLQKLNQELGIEDE